VPPALGSPSIAAHQALVHVQARCEDWAAVFDTVERMERMVEAGLARPVSVSVHRWGRGKARRAGQLRGQCLYLCTCVPCACAPVCMCTCVPVCLCLDGA